MDVLRDEYYEVVDQSDEACFFLPEVTGDVVIFPGVCDQDIPVVQDFRAADVSHEISKILFKDIFLPCGLFCSLLNVYFRYWFSYFILF